MKSALKWCCGCFGVAIVGIKINGGKIKKEKKRKTKGAGKNHHKSFTSHRVKPIGKHFYFITFQLHFLLPSAF